MGTRSCVVLIDQDRILMVRQFYRGEEIWTFPGGNIEEYETPKEAAIREVKEETNYDIEIIRLLLEMYNDRINGMYYCFLGKLIGGTMKLGIDPERLGDVQELKEVEWKLIDEVKENIEVTRIIDQL